MMRKTNDSATLYEASPGDRRLLRSVSPTDAMTSWSGAVIVCVAAPKQNSQASPFNPSSSHSLPRRAASQGKLRNLRAAHRTRGQAASQRSSTLRWILHSWWLFPSS